MFKKIRYSFLVLVSTAFSGYAQENIASLTAADAVAILGGRICNSNFNFQYDGSPYLEKEFAPGRILHEGTFNFTNVPLRYNCFFDEMEYRESGKDRIYALKPDTLFNWILIRNDTFVVESYEKEKVLTRGYFKLLDCGRISLLVKNCIEFREAQRGTTHKSAMPARFMKKSDKYYLKMPGKPAQPFKNAKNLFACLGSHETDMTNFAKENKLSFKKEEDLRKLLVFYNSLP